MRSPPISWDLLWWASEHLTQKVCRWNAERVGDALESGETELNLSTFDIGDVGGADAGSACEVYLTPAAALTYRADPLPNLDDDGALHPDMFKGALGL